MGDDPLRKATGFMNRRLFGVLYWGLAIAALTGCQHIGPRTIVDDRIPYNDAIATSWKQQTLLNIVRVRYGDIPEFVDVPSIVNGYELGRSGSAGFGTQLQPQNTLMNWVGLDFQGTHTLVDRPTISYAPQTGSEFIRNLTNPIPPVSIFNLIESGTPADLVMELAVESINGLRNRSYVGNMQASDPEFLRVIQIMKKAQASGHVSLRVSPIGDRKDAAVLLGIRDDGIDPGLAAELDQLRAMLRLDPQVKEFKVVFGMLPNAKDEIAIRTRSILRIMTFLALDVQVPECHLADGTAPDLGNLGSNGQSHLMVHSGSEPPCNAYASVCYQGYWFWIDRRDFPSKRTMLYLKILLALADTQQKEAAPALTIQAN